MALAHFKEVSAVPDLIGLLMKDERPVIRGTAAWAIGKIGTSEGKQALEKALELEKDQEVIDEIHKGLAFETIY